MKDFGEEIYVCKNPETGKYYRSHTDDVKNIYEATKFNTFIGVHWYDRVLFYDEIRKIRKEKLQKLNYENDMCKK